MEPTDAAFMRLALAEAVEGGRQGNVPVGAVIVRAGQVIAKAHNLRHTTGNPVAHAEMLAIADAARVVGNWRLTETTLYVTLEPCAMCAGGIVLARVPRVVFGTSDPKAGACGSLFNLVQDPRLNHRVELSGGALEKECGDLLRDFFRARRARKPAKSETAPSSEGGEESGEVPERLNGSVSKTDVGVTLPGVQIPPSPLDLSEDAGSPAS